MDMAAAALKHNVESSVKKNKLGIKTIMVAPAPSELPDDGVLAYTAVTSVYDFKNLEDRQVALFAEADIDALRVVASNQDAFGVSLVVLQGLPGAEYSVQFEQDTWQLDRLAYGPLVSEIVLEHEVQNSVRASQLTQHDRERNQYTRADGSVKPNTAMRLVDTVDDAEAVEDEDA